jgi:hypothetical protein
MISRSFLSGAVAQLGRKAIAVRDRMATRPAAPAPRPEPADDTKRRDHAMARFILRRVGIAPLAPAVALLIALNPFDGATAQSAQVRATATARATILTASASLRQGQVIVTSARTGTVHPTVQPTIRACDPIPPSQPAAPATCRMIVYDLP